MVFRLGPLKFNFAWRRASDKMLVWVWANADFGLPICHTCHVLSVHKMGFLLSRYSHWEYLESAKPSREQSNKFRYHSMFPTKYRVHKESFVPKRYDELWWGRIVPYHTFQTVWRFTPDAAFSTDTLKFLGDEDSEQILNKIHANLLNS